MKSVITVLLMALAFASGLTSAADAAAPAAASTSVPAPKALLESKRCVVCHDERLTRIAPPFVKIAHRYHNIEGARERLIRTIQHGTDGPTPVYHFGDETMPKENVRVPVNDAEAAILADYILSLK